MSKYQVHKTKFTNKALLVKAFEVVCQQLRIQFEQHDDAKPLVGFQGDQRSEVANFIVRRRHVGMSSNDFGLVWDAEQHCYTAIQSDYDLRQGYTERILKALRQEYSNQQIAAVVAQRRTLGHDLTIVWDQQKDGSRLIRLKGTIVS